MGPLLLVVWFIIAAAVAAAVTPGVIGLAVSAGAVDHPRGRRAHAAPTPSWGGLAMLIGFAAAIVAALSVGPLPASSRGIPLRQLGAVALGACAISVLGAVDDRFEMRALPKLVGQVACAAVLPLFGVAISGLGGYAIPLWLGSLLTVVWVVAIVNAVNLIDGLDGLAAGVVAIASSALAVVALGRGQVGAAAMSAALAGAAAGFLPYNFNPARVFMGDLGSHFLGYTAAAIAVLGTFKIAASVVLLTPVIAFAVPILDTLWAMIRRYRMGHSIARADRNHLHYRLVDRGLSQRQAVLVIYAITAVCSAAAVGISWVR